MNKRKEKKMKEKNHLWNMMFKALAKKKKLITISITSSEIMSKKRMKKREIETVQSNTHTHKEE